MVIYGYEFESVCISAHIFVLNQAVMAKNAALLP